MEKTGESYTAARRVLLADDSVVMTMSDDAIRRRTGHGWEHWFDLLDEWGATERSHTEMATWLRGEQDTGGWNAQAIAVSYERARGLRAVGEHADGFTVTASKTVDVPIDRLYDAFVDERVRRRWLPEAELRERTATRPRSARYDWGDDGTRVVVGFESKTNGKSLVSLAHEKLPDAEQAERMKAYWRERVANLKEVLEA
jgi:uncharacterized protein YndB with AHSA1/START domain